mgnify:CR=1 FL=1
MKKLLVLLFSLFLLSSPSVFADDISDFEIEGISIGDSLLDYMTEDEILKEIERTKDFFYHLNEPNKYAEVYLVIESENYDYLGFVIKNNSTNQYIADTNEKYIIPKIRESILKNNSTNQYITNINEKYTILSIRGIKRYMGDFDGCIAKRDEVVGILSKMFPHIDKVDDEEENYFPDPSGKSIMDEVHFELDNEDLVRLWCDDYDETFRIKMGWSEGLTVMIMSSEINEWLGDV